MLVVYMQGDRLVNYIGNENGLLVRLLEEETFEMRLDNFINP